MREYSLAVTLHMFTLPKDSSGVAHYHGVSSPQGVQSSGNVDPDRAASFLEGEGGALLGPVRTKTLGSFLGVSFRGRRGRDRGTSFIGLEEETGSPVIMFTKGPL